MSTLAGAIERVVVFRVPDAACDVPFLAHRRRLVPVLFGAAFLSLFALTALVSEYGAPRLEDHLKRDVVASIARDAPDVVVAVDGRAITLRGTVGSTRVRETVIRRVKSRWGVLSVDATKLKVAQTT